MDFLTRTSIHGRGAFMNICVTIPQSSQANKTEMKRKKKKTKESAWGRCIHEDLCNVHDNDRIHFKQDYQEEGKIGQKYMGGERERERERERESTVSIFVEETESFLEL